MIFNFFQAKVNIIMENTGRLLQKSPFFILMIRFVISKRKKNMNTNNRYHVGIEVAFEYLSIL